MNMILNKEIKACCGICDDYKNIGETVIIQDYSILLFTCKRCLTKALELFDAN